MSDEDVVWELSVTAGGDEQLILIGSASIGNVVLAVMSHMKFNLLLFSLAVSRAGTKIVDE